MKTRNKEYYSKELLGCLKTIVGGILSIGSFLAIIFIFYSLIGLIHGPIPEPIINIINLDFGEKDNLYICPKSSETGIMLTLNGWGTLGGNVSSANGINLLFTSPTYNTEVQIFAPCKADWDNRIKVSSKNKEILFSRTKSMFFPAELFSKQNKEIKCSVSGDLFYPTTNGGVGFINTKKNITKEINLHIISDRSYIAMQDSITNAYKNKLEIEKMEFRTSGTRTRIFLAFGFIIVSVLLMSKFNLGGFNE